MQRVKTITEGVEDYRGIVEKYGFTEIAEGDLRDEGEVIASIRVAERAKKNSWDMMYAIANRDGVIVARGESLAIDSKRRIEEAFQNATEMLHARAEARRHVRRMH